MPDIIRVEILIDGTIRTENDRISAANHMTAESFMREVAKLAGGTVKITSKAKHGHQGHAHGESAHQH